MIGVDLGGTKLLAGVIDADGRVRARRRIEVAGLDATAVIEALATSVGALVAGFDGEIAGVGYGIPGTIDQRTGTVVVAAHLDLDNVPMRDMLQDRTGLPAIIDNDANVAALAEQRLGVGAGVTDDLLMITLGTGLGGGIIAGGRILRGALGAGAELGHVTIDIDGPACVSPNCRNRGCIETFVSGSALARDARRIAKEEPSSALALAIAGGAAARGETIVELARDGDARCLDVLEELGRHLGVALAGFVNIFNPGVIAVGGGLSPALDLILPTARREIVERALEPGSSFVRVVPATLGQDAGMVGAGLLAHAELVVDRDG